MKSGICSWNAAERIFLENESQIFNKENPRFLSGMKGPWIPDFYAFWEDHWSKTGLRRDALSHLKTSIEKQKLPICNKSVIRSIKCD